MSNKFNNSVACEKDYFMKNKIDQLISICSFGKKKANVALLRLDGVIGKINHFSKGNVIKDFAPLIDKIFQIKNLDMVCLIINSPGGSPVQSELISTKIIQSSKHYGVPVYSFIEDMAASGGYWVALSGEKIFASKNSLVGSIGVVYQGFGMVEALKKIGIERRVFTKEKCKSLLDPFLEIKKSDLKIIDTIQTNIQGNFIKYVQKRRGDRLTKNTDIFNGAIWTGEDAVNLGLIDEIGDLYSFIYDMYKSEVNIINIEQKQSWFKRIFNTQYNQLQSIEAMFDKVVANFFNIWH